jgi:APA family basic amino acid/polyamine antiporter
MNKFRYWTVTAVVIANMVGTGVFTSLGFQLLDIRSGFVLLMLWAVGGVVAVCGAMTYAELGAALPRSGGEYNFLARIYHPAAGFVSGWVSATIGFAGPTALAAMTFAAYATSAFPAAGDPWSRKLLAVGLVILLTAVHASNRRTSGGLQVVFTILKVGVIASFCVAAVVVADQPQPLRFLPSPGDGALLASGAFAVSLIYVSYAYTGWNAATYLSSELEDPQRTLPRILMIGTLLVMLLPSTSPSFPAPATTSIWTKELSTSRTPPFSSENSATLRTASDTASPRAIGSSPTARTSNPGPIGATGTFWSWPGTRTA